ncbi:MAG: hypothetical protein HFI90_07525 [Clostridia bacterium]|nr:hypothetical protein [Clostridia bacterium]
MAVRAFPTVAGRDSLDWKDLSAAEITQRVSENVQNGSICLFHNEAKHTPEALEQLIPKLQQEGYSFVPVSQLIYKQSYSIDHAGRQSALQATGANLY